MYNACNNLMSKAMTNPIVEEGKKLIQNLEVRDAETRDHKTAAEIEQQLLDDLDSGKETVVDNVGATNNDVDLS